MKPSAQDMEVDQNEPVDQNTHGGLTPVGEEDSSGSESSLSDAEDIRADLSTRLLDTDRSFVPEDVADNIITEPDLEAVPCTFTLFQYAEYSCSLSHKEPYRR
jgi:hypothetical protein